MHDTSTRSPGATVLTPAPTCSTVPTASWPRIRPGGHLGHVPLQYVQVRTADGRAVHADDGVGVVVNRRVGTSSHVLGPRSVVDECLHVPPPGDDDS